MRKIILLLFSFLLLIKLSLTSQPHFPASLPVFDSTLVARIDISINPDTLAWIYENPESDIGFRANFIFHNGTISDTLNDVGFRLRGNTSRYSQKKSFKISFDEYEKGREFYGLEKLNLNGEHNDPSIIRSRICWQMARDFGIPAPRASHSEVYINGNYYGLYILVEQIDNTFADSRYGNKYGNLYKCLWPADLDYLGSDPDLYKFTSGDRRAYELMNNNEEDDYSDLAHFIDVLNNTPSNQLACELEKVFNLADYLKVMAFDIFIGDWDGYIYNKNNFYLYHNTETGKFEYMPYDLDNTLGIDWMGQDWGIRDIYDWEQHMSEKRPLYTRLMEIPEVRDQYSFYMKQLIDQIVDQDSLLSSIDNVKTMISPYVEDDPYYPLDYGYTYTDFLNSYVQPLGGHVDYGLKPYIEIRRSTALQQLIINDINAVVKYIHHNPAVPDHDYRVRAYVEDEDPSPSVKLAYRLNFGALLYSIMYDDGNHWDKEAGDGIYGCILSPLPMNTVLAWQVDVQDYTGNTTLLPCDPVLELLQPSSDPQLFINELMASNHSAIADEYGEYDDWIELYNGDNRPIWLGDKFLTDNLQDPSAWQLPDVTLQPGDFLLIWADNEPGQGPRHTNYKIDAASEEVDLFDAASTGYYLLDSISFSQQMPDISLGRSTDGGDPWIYFNKPTPGYSNTASGIHENKIDNKPLTLYPNPLSSNILYLNRPFIGCLYNAYGSLIWRGSRVKEIDLGNLPAGIYFMKEDNGYSYKIVKL